MTAAQMLSLLRVYVQDSSASRADADLYSLLSQGQRRLVVLLPDHLLRALETTETSLALVGGALNLSSGLAATLHNGETGILSVQETGGKFARKISYDSYRSGENRSRSYTTNRPRFYVVGTTLYMLPTSITSIDMVFRKTPADISASQDCELDAALHDLVVSLGAYYVFLADNKITRADAQLKQAQIDLDDYLTHTRATEELELSPVDDRDEEGDWVLHLDS